MKLGVQRDAIGIRNARAERAQRARIGDDRRRVHGGGEAVSVRRKWKCGQRCVKQ